MRAWFSRRDFASAMISSFIFLYLRSCEGDSVSLCSWLAISCSCRRRSFLYSEAILSKVSTTFGFSSASMAASDIWFSNSSSSMSPSAAASAGSFSSASASPAGAARNGVGDGGAAGGATCAGADCTVAPLPFAAGLDAFRNRDFAFARQQFHRAHLAQIHADGIVGALAGLGFLDLGDGLLRDLDQLVVGLVVGFFLLVLGIRLFGLGDVDAHVREHRHDVFDLFGRGGVGGQHFVELIEGHEAALLGLLDHLLDGGIRQIEQRRRRVRRILLGRVRCLVVFFLVFNLQRLCLGGHSSSSRNALMRGCAACD